MAEPGRLIRERLAEFERLQAPLLEREARARELAETVPPAPRYFGLFAVKCAEEAMDVGGYSLLRPVVNPPGLVHVLRAAKRRHTDYLAVSRYSDAITSELAVGVGGYEPQTEKEAVGIAWHAVALLKLINPSNALCPAWASVSWDTISAVSDGSVRFRALDDVPRQIAIESGGPVSSEQAS